MTRFLSALLFVLLCGPALAAAPLENAALGLVVADLKTLSDVDRLFQRYIWIEGAVHEDFQATSAAVNYLVQGPEVRRPIPLGVDKLMVVRVDLRLLAERSNEDLNKLVKTWEEFQFDPKFNLLITKDTLKFLDVPAPTVKKTLQEKVMVDVKPYKGADGKEYTKKWETVNKVVDVPFAEANVDVVRLPSEHINIGLYEQAANLTRSQAPLVSHRYWMFRSLSTIQDQGVYKTLYGGLYYELAGVRESQNKKGTDLDQTFEDLGIGNIEAGITADKLFNRLRSDMAGVIMKSGVTGKRRKWQIFPTLTNTDGGIFSLTSDIRDQDIDIGTDPLMNLLVQGGKPVHEGIWNRPNGFHGFALWDGNQKLAREVPPDVANDSTIPTPHTQRLEGALGCISCHAKDRGWRILTNDVQRLIADNLPDRLGVAGDVSKNQAQQDAILRIQGLYRGNVERSILPRARDNYAVAVLKATGPWKESKQAQTDVVELTSLRITRIVRGWRYEKVDAATALLEMGYEFKPGEELSTLKALWPPVNVVIDGVIPEDPRLAALKAGLSINRFDWDLVYSFGATRAAKAVKK